MVEGGDMRDIWLRRCQQKALELLNPAGYLIERLDRWQRDREWAEVLMLKEGQRMLRRLEPEGE